MMRTGLADLVLELCNARDAVKIEEAKGVLSPHWEDTYGFGRSEVHARFRQAYRALNDRENEILEKLN